MTISKEKVLYVILLICFIAVFPVFAQQFQFSVDRIIDTQISPNYNKIACIISLGNENILLIMNADGSDVRKLPTSKEILSVRWSMDSKKIAYQYFKSKKILFLKKPGFYIGVCSPFKQSRRVFWSTKGHSPIWSPKSDRIVFTRDSFDKKNHTFCMNLWLGLLNYKKTRRLTFAKSSREFCFGGWWSANDEKIYFFRSEDVGDNPRDHYNLWVIDPNGLKGKQLTKNLDIEPSSFKMAFPDSKKAVFIAPRINGSIWIINLSTGDRKKIFGKNNKTICSLVWAPDNSKIASCVEGTIWVINIDKGEKKEVLKNAGCGQIIGWTPENKIIFIRNKNTIWMMNSDGSNQHQIFPKPKEKR